MKTIWKFPIPIQDHHELSMPVGARVLCVQTQGGTGMLWAEVDHEAPREVRRFRLVGTGHSLPTDTPLRYIGTFQTPLPHISDLESLVWHLFELVS